MEMAKSGVWTPTAKVICIPCNNEIKEDWVKRFGDKEPQPVYPGSKTTKCDMCGAVIQLHKSIAEEHNIVLELKTYGYDAYMEQTGGMNNAGSVLIKGGIGYYMFTYDLDSDGEYMISKYYYVLDDCAEVVDTDFVEGSTMCFTTAEDLVEYIKSLPDLKGGED